MSINNQIYYILKIIDDTDDFDTVDLDEIFKIENLDISKSKFYHLVKNLIEKNYIEGLTIRFSNLDEPVIAITSPSLTIKGKTFLEENSQLKKLYRIIKEVKTWF